MSIDATHITIGSEDQPISISSDQDEYTSTESEAQSHMAIDDTGSTVPSTTNETTEVDEDEQEFDDCLHKQMDMTTANTTLPNAIHLELAVQQLMGVRIPCSYVKYLEERYNFNGEFLTVELCSACYLCVTRNNCLRHSLRKHPHLSHWTLEQRFVVGSSDHSLSIYSNQREVMLGQIQPLRLKLLNKGHPLYNDSVIQGRFYELIKGVPKHELEQLLYGAFCQDKQPQVEKYLEEEVKKYSLLIKCQQL